MLAGARAGLTLGGPGHDDRDGRGGRIQRSTSSFKLPAEYDSGCWADSDGGAASLTHRVAQSVRVLSESGPGMVTGRRIAAGWTSEPSGMYTRGGCGC